jgi:hypothetical protein
MNDLRAEPWPFAWPPDEHCYSHQAHEPWTQYCYRRCLECGHVFRSEYELQDTDVMARWMSPTQVEAPPARPAVDIHVCPVCAHDF